MSALETTQKLLRAGCRIIWVTLNNIYCIPLYTLTLILLIPVYLVSPASYYKIEETLFTWLLSMVSCWCYSAGYSIAESGDSLDENLKYKILYMPNHQSTADVPFLMSIFTSRFGYSGRVMWLMDKVFKFTNFGIVSWLHDDFFIQAGKDTREQSLIDLRKHMHKVFGNKERDCLVLFPEGGFLRKRKAVSQSFAKKKDLPQLEHCTIPRTGALDVILEVMGPKGNSPKHKQIRKIVDVTVAYPEGNPVNLQSIITGWRPACTTHVHYRVFDVEELPTQTEELFMWMVKRYQEKDEMLAEFYKTGVFPHDMYNKAALPPRIIQHSPARFILGHFFFLAGSAFAALLSYKIYHFFV